MAGTVHPQTLRMKGKIRHQEVVVLVDGGSTHNFIDQMTVNRLSLPVVQDQSFEVMVGNSEKITSTRRCLNLNLQLQDYTLIADFYILEVSSCQVVLGV